MTEDAEWAGYLTGDSDGQDLRPEGREALDRIRGQLGDASTWTPVPVDARSRLLAAAAAEADSVGDATGDVTGDATGGDEREETSAAGGRAADRPRPIPPSHRSRPTPVESPSTDEPPSTVPTERSDHVLGDESTTVVDFDDRRSRRTRSRLFGTGAVVAAAAVVAVAFFAGNRLAGSAGSGPEVASTYLLAATDLDPDAVASVDVKPTVAGVEFELTVMGLDNTEPPDYYSAWLMNDGGDTVPLGSFHWRAGGVPIILWSGVDSPAYNRFTITAQVQGDGGVRSDRVVLTGAIPDLTAPTDTTNDGG